MLVRGRCALLCAAALALAAGCHPARYEPPEHRCYSQTIRTCQACVNAGCAWCSEGSGGADGYCCGQAGSCAAPIVDEAACGTIARCDDLPIASCGECLRRGCGWCASEDRCRSRQPDGTWPSCDGGIVAGADTCPADDADTSDTEPDGERAGDDDASDDGEPRRTP